MSGIGSYPYSLMGYSYSPYLQNLQLQPGLLNQQTQPQQTLQSVPAYGANIYTGQPVGAIQTSSLLQQQFQGLGTQPAVHPGTQKVESVPAVPSHVEPPVDETPENKDEYIQELIKERETIENSSVSNLSKSHVLRLLNQEISRLQGGGVFYGDDVKFLDVYREKCTRATIRVLVPLREHPKFNFVGKLLGPKGNSLKRLQEDTLTKMAVLGRGSMRDREKEEELRGSGDPKYGHLQEELHVEITAYAPPAEAYARLAFALTEVRKYLIPDSNDTIRQQQMRELEILTTGIPGMPGMPQGVVQGIPGMVPVDPTSQLQLMTSPSILMPSHGYHIPLLPTPPLDTPPSPTISAQATKYEHEDSVDHESVYKDKSKPKSRKFSPY